MSKFRLPVDLVLSARVILLMGLLASISACVPGMLVKKEQVKKISRVAIISLHTNRQVEELSKKGKVTRWRTIDQRIIARRYVTNFEKLLRKQMKWKVLSSRRLSQYKSYRRHFWRKGKLRSARLARKSYIYPSRLNPITIDMADNKLKQFTLKTLGNLARRLRVDALILVKGHYSYQGVDLSPLGTGQAWLYSQTWFQMVNQKGEIIVDMPRPQSNEFQSRYEKKLVVIKRNLAFHGKRRYHLRKAFILTARDSSNLAIQRLADSLKK